MLCKKQLNLSYLLQGLPSATGQAGVSPHSIAGQGPPGGAQVPQDSLQHSSPSGHSKSPQGVPPVVFIFAEGSLGRSVQAKMATNLPVSSRLSLFAQLTKFHSAWPACSSTGTATNQRKEEKDKKTSNQGYSGWEQ